MTTTPPQDAPVEAGASVRISAGLTPETVPTPRAGSASRATSAVAGAPPARPKGSGWLGALAGLVGIGCCVYPVVLVLLGLSTAVAAVDLGNRLFAEWGWAFKTAGVAFALAALWIQRRRARACAVDARPSLLRNALVIGGVGVATYAALYGVTTWLGTLAS
jgi:hypothetical protein